MYAIYGNMDPINIPQMLAYIPYMDPMGGNYIEMGWHEKKTNKPPGTIRNHHRKTVQDMSKSSFV